MRTIKEVSEFLEKPIPRDEVSTRDGGRGRKLSYLETWRVIDLMNEAFGNLGWDSETVELREVPGKFPTYYARVRLTALVQASEGSYIKIVKEGCGWGADKSEQNAHEMAVKEAESDALKRAAMKFGKRLGLALYDKSQEFITDGDEATVQQGHGSEAKKLQGSADRPAGNDTGGKGQVASGASKDLSKTQGRLASPPQGRELLNKQISQYAKVALDKKVLTQDQLLAMLKAYNASKKEELSDEQASEVLAKLKEAVNT